MGSAKLAVFPVPVWAHPRRSRPSSSKGIACACTGDGMVYFSSRKTRWRGAANGNASNSFGVMLFKLPAHPMSEAGGVDERLG